MTGGINSGVMRYVGEAMRDYYLTAASTVPVVALGITTWGCVKNREDLQDDFVRVQVQGVKFKKIQLYGFISMYSITFVSKNGYFFPGIM